MKVKSLWFEKLNDQEIDNIARLKFPIKLSYHISRAMKKLREEAKTYVEQKKTVFDEHKNGENKIKPEEMHMFLKKVSELCDMEVEISGIDKHEVNMDDLPDMSVLQLEFLEPFLNIKE